MKKLLLPLVAAMLGYAGLAAGEPVTLYRIDLNQGCDAYRFAADHALPLFYAGQGVLLAGRPVDAGNCPQVAGIALAFAGDSRDLRWAHARRGAAPAELGAPAVFSDGAVAVVPARSGGKGADPARFLLSDFTARAIVPARNTEVANPSLTADTAIARIAQQVTVANFQATDSALQAFNTRSTGAPNHPQVAEWIRGQFLGFGIADVRIDSYLDPGFISYLHSQGVTGSPLIRNVIATIPGTLDTHTVYVVGGHYDTSVWPYNPWAPGADDNGSGAAATLEMARVMAANPPHCTVTFVAFDCEEWGLYGSKKFAQDAAAGGMNIGCMMNYDMIANIGNDSIFNSEVYPGSEQFAHLFADMAGLYGRTNDTNLVAVYSTGDLSGSDSWSFYQNGFKQSYAEEYLFSDHWHLTNDSTAYMNMRYGTSIVRAGIGLLATLANYPPKVTGVAVADLGTGTQLQVKWSPAQPAPAGGYRIRYGTASGSYAFTQDAADTIDTLSGLTPNATYYITVWNLGDGSRQSLVADEATGVPVWLTRDQGVLVVDETNNWTSGSFPRDAQQDSFYEYLLDGYRHQQFDFGSAGQKPALADLAPYSAVVWHSDDPSQFLASNDTGALRNYLRNGGKAWFTAWKATGDLRNSASYPANFGAGSLVYDFFKAGHAELSGTTDSFQLAAGLRGYPDIMVDTTKYPATIYGKTMRNIEGLTPAGSADTVYVMGMKNSTSAYQGRACAVRDSGKTVLFGFPLYYMNRDQARAAARRVLAEFGEPYLGVGGTPTPSSPAVAFRLEAARPNPFTRSTTVNFQLPKPEAVELAVYNIAGQKVRTLASGVTPSGAHAVKWDGRDQTGQALSAGVYLVRLSAGQRSQTSKLIIVR